MRIRFYNANIVDFDEDNGTVYGELCTKDNLIEYVGCQKQTGHFDREIDCKGNLLIPGFVDAHTHSAMTLFRGIKDNVNLQTWLWDNIIPLEKKLTEKDVYIGSKLACLEYIAGGITTIDDMYDFPFGLIKATEESGIRARINALFYTGNGETENKKLLDYVQNHDRLSVCSTVHSIYGTEAENIDNAVNFAGKYKLRFSTHLSETLKEVNDCISEHKKTPPEYLEDFGFLDRGVSLYHCVHVDKDDADVLARHETTIVTCPSSNLKLASGIAPIVMYKNKGINIAIGTDGAASNNSLDMFKEMFLTATLNTCQIGQPDALTAKEVLYFATKGGAISLGIDNLGELKVGNLADVVLVDMNAAHTTPQNNLLSNLVYCSRPSDVILTMCNGNILYENGQYHNGINAEKIKQEARETISKLKEKN